MNIVLFFYNRQKRCSFFYPPMLGRLEAGGGDWIVPHGSGGACGDPRVPLGFPDPQRLSPVAHDRSQHRPSSQISWIFNDVHRFAIDFHWFFIDF